MCLAAWSSASPHSRDKTLTTQFGSILSSQRRLVLSLDDVLSRGQAWRLVTHNFVLSTPGELLFGVVLLYYFRQFERHLGSARYARSRPRPQRCTPQLLLLPRFLAVKNISTL